MNTSTNRIVLFAIRGNHYRTLKEDPSRIFAGDWREIDGDAQDAGTQIGVADVLDVSRSDSDRVLLAYSDGWTFISFSHRYIAVNSIYLAARLSGVLKSETFLVSQIEEWDACWIGLYDGSFRTLRFIQKFKASDEGGGVAFGPPHETEQGLSDFWSSDTALKMFQRWGGPTWIAEKDPAGAFEEASFLELSQDDDWFETDELLLRLQNTNWFDPRVEGDSDPAPVQTDFALIKPARPRPSRKKTGPTIGSALFIAVAMAVIILWIFG